MIAAILAYWAILVGGVWLFAHWRVSQPRRRVRSLLARPSDRSDTTAASVRGVALVFTEKVNVPVLVLLVLGPPLGLVVGRTLVG
jgi:hypothetical protein